MTRDRSARYALLCGLAFLAAALLIWPVLESGMNDDWSIVYSAQAFAQTGHIHYNAWEAPMLLWQIWTSGLAIKLFGFSYLIVRLCTIAHAFVLVLLFHRCCVRSGLSERSATFATLVLTFTPVFLGCAVAAMTDVIGLLALICCLYGCLRALQASSVRHAGLWLCVAAVSDVAISSARQVDFIGALVLVPCTVYLLRRHRPLVLLGGVLWLLSCAVIGSLLHWFSHQPYILPQSIIPHPYSPAMPSAGVSVLAYAVLDASVLIFPALLVLLPAWRRPPARALSLVAGLGALFLVGHLVYHVKHPTRALAPFFLVTFYHQTAENTFNAMMMPPKGLPPVGLSLPVQVGLTVLSFFGAATWLLALLRRKDWPVRERDANTPIPWRDLLTLLLPLLLAYGALLLPRGVLMTPPDRYLLGFFPFVLILVVRFAARHFEQGIPRVATAALVIMGVYSVTTMHDAFATFRANLRVIQQLRAAGVPREAIDGGWEYNFETQVLHHGYTDASGTTRPDGTLFEAPRAVERGPCGELLPMYSPDVHALYAISWPDTPCTRVQGFQPVQYTTWLPPFRRELLVIEAQPKQWIPYDQWPH